RADVVRPRGAPRRATIDRSRHRRRRGDSRAPRAIARHVLPLVALTQTQIDMLAAQVEGGVTNVQDIYPLAPLQEGMVFHHLLHAESDAHMEAYFVGFRTRARLDHFLDALRMIVDRHDILRTGIFWEDSSSRCRSCSVACACRSNSSISIRLTATSCGNWRRDTIPVRTASTSVGLRC
ncbi:condensation domain-containing protein, partial [Burkholderia pseudomallei]|uniref:condensation domain-containing protein n=1 Tax=Burkholderia pseudomallei TaxID=28450 RepID=UPI002468FBEA